MKIIHIIPSLNKGGAERCVVDLCNELAMIHSVEVILISLKDNLAGKSFISEINSRVRYISLAKKGGFELKVLLNVTSILKKEKPDIVNTHINAIEYININLLLNSPSSKVFHTIHSKAQQECPYEVLRRMRKVYFRNDKVTPITISQDGKSTYQQYYGLNNDRLIPNGRPYLKTTSELAELQKLFPSSPHEYLFVNVGRVVDVKNQAMLVRSVQMFNNLHHEKKCRLLIVGDLRDQEIVNDLKRTINGDPYINLTGDKNNIADYLSIADAYCLSSHYEGMPISLIEAFSMGCIPICTSVGGIPEMITDGVNGFLSKSTTEQGFLDAINNFHTSDKRHEIRENGQKTFVDKYHIGITARRYYDLYEAS